MIEAVAEVGSGGGVGLVLVGVATAVLLVDKSLVLLFTNTVPCRHRPLSHPLLSAVPGLPGLKHVAVSTWASQHWKHVALVCPRVTPQPWVEKKNSVPSSFEGLDDLFLLRDVQGMSTGIFYATRPASGTTGL